MVPHYRTPQPLSWGQQGIQLLVDVEVVGILVAVVVVVLFVSIEPAGILVSLSLGYIKAKSFDKTFCVISFVLYNN